ncbi:cytochrome c oxidase assembly factor CtaG [Bacillus suaedaesalsae]|uniref:Cytochrome c oxidase assembly factor CtaG n=1 Tax=Bacillus suaedaesalsae TaxID=2810349 RepID=A0ABS2DJC3_9BACI|nr:cytochrome c oxidase assembly factor CtaG [Bacillus suaedaesalsae]MBM6618589.1 cytochrome c oxidase assembly factor CtaG [Bacillus suaedaesalsae]
MDISIFGFRALWSPIYLVIIIGIIGFYFFLIRKDKYKVTRQQAFFFVSSMVLLYLMKGGPFDLLGHLMFSAHMTAMAVVYLAVPPLLILGLPTSLIREVINGKWIKPIFDFLTKPLVALILFNGIFSIYHIPLVFDVVKTDELLHSITTTVLFFGALFMWWPVVNPLPEAQSLSPIKKIGYIFADGVLLTPACALIIFAGEPMYTTYTDSTMWLTALELCVPADMIASLNISTPELFNWFPLIEDQQLGGVIMKVVQEIVYGSILGYIFFQWAKKEREKDELEVKSEPHIN